MAAERAIYVLTTGTYSDYHLVEIVSGPPGADMQALRWEHIKAGSEVTPRMMGCKAYRVTHSDGRSWVFVRTAEDAVAEFAASDTVEVDDAKLDITYAEQDRYGWDALFGEWLVRFHGFTALPYEEFNI